MQQLEVKGKLVTRIIDQDGDVYLKYKIIDAGVDGNGHGVTWNSIKKNLPKVLSKPFVEFPDDFTFNGAYGKYHPYTSRYNTTVENEVIASSRFATGNIVDFSFYSDLLPEEKQSGFITTHITDPVKAALYKKDPKTIPQEVSNMMVVSDPENEPNCEDWEIVNVSVVPKAAYPNAKPVAICIGGQSCVNEIKGSVLTDKGKIKLNSFHLPDNKIKLRIKLGEKPDAKKDPLNKFNVTPKANSPTGEKEKPATSTDSRIEELLGGMNTLKDTVNTLVKINQDKEASERQKAIEALIPATHIGIVYKDEAEREADIKKKLDGNLSLSEISEVVNAKVLAIEATNAIQKHPELSSQPEFAGLPQNVIVGSSQKDKGNEMSDEDKIRKMRSLNSAFGVY